MLYAYAKDLAVIDPSIRRRAKAQHQATRVRNSPRRSFKCDGTGVGGLQPKSVHHEETPHTRRFCPLVKGVDQVKF